MNTIIPALDTATSLSNDEVNNNLEILKKINKVTKQVKSLTDAAYQQARAGDTCLEMAAYCIKTIAGFPEAKVSKETRDELNKGYRLRFQEVYTGKTVKTEEGGVLVDVNFAFGFTQQAFGGLKAEKPKLHAAVKDVRDKTGTYCSNRFSDLVHYAKQIQGEGKKGARQTASLHFNERVTKVMDDLMTKVKVAEGRGDTEADKVKLTKAIAAFKAVWNK